MGKLVSKFKIERRNGRHVITMLDQSSSVTESVFVVEGDSLSDNVKQILSYVYDECREFYEGYAPVRCGNLWGYVDVALCERITPAYEDVYQVQEGFALVKKEDKYTFFHLVSAAIGKAFVLRPRMNRFVCNNKIYQRNNVTVAFTVKKKFEDRAEEGLAFFEYDPKETIDSYHAHELDEDVE